MPRELVARRYIRTRLVPFYEGAYNRRRRVNLQPSTTFTAGQALGKAGAAANDVQTLTVTGTPTGGTLTVTVVDPLSGNTAPITLAYNSAASAAQTAARAALGNSDVAVTGGPLPGSTLVFTYTGRYASIPVALMTADVTTLTGGTPAASFAHTTQGRTAGTYGAYVGGGATDPCKCLMEYSCTTDASGNVTYGSQGYTGEGTIEPDAPAWFGGIFRLGDTTGLDAGAIADLAARFESGAGIGDAESIFLIP